MSRHACLFSGNVNVALHLGWPHGCGWRLAYINAMQRLQHAILWPAGPMQWLAEQLSWHAALGVSSRHRRHRLAKAAIEISGGAAGGESVSSAALSRRSYRGGMKAWLENRRRHRVSAANVIS